MFRLKHHRQATYSSADKLILYRLGHHKVCQGVVFPAPRKFSTFLQFIRINSSQLERLFPTVLILSIAFLFNQRNIYIKKELSSSRHTHRHYLVGKSLIFKNLKISNPFFPRSASDIFFSVEWKVTTAKAVTNQKHYKSLHSVKRTR